MFLLLFLTLLIECIEFVLLVLDLQFNAKFFKVKETILVQIHFLRPNSLFEKFNYNKIAKLSIYGKITLI